MKNIPREDIHNISRHISLTEQVMSRALKENVYNDKEAWQKFLRLLFLTLGIGFTVAGVFFFFAYNWASLHKFAKIGLAEGLIISATLLTLSPKINSDVKNVILTGASFLVGVLFAVFGQIYQTGANAYDFFLGWTVFVTLWVFVSNFAPLWLFYLILINTTLVLYSQQVAKEWSEVFVLTLLFIINAIAIVASYLLIRYRAAYAVPVWFLNTVGLAAVSCATLGIVIGIFDDYQIVFPVLVLLTVIAFSLAFWNGLKEKSLFYIAVIPFSLIVIVSALLIKVSNEGAFFLLIIMFILISVTLVIKNLIDLNRKWTNEK